MRTFVLLIFCCIIFNSCSDKKIDTHFYLSTGETSDEVTINYVVDNDYQFEVIKPKVESYKKCGKYIYVVQQPLLNDRLNEADRNYFIIDTDIDYSNEKLAPKPITKKEFDDIYVKACNL